MQLRSKPPSQPIDQLSVLAHRRPLSRTRQRLQEKRLTLGFIGGSITADSEYSWPNPVIAWFLDSYPDTMITVENAAIGATGSDSGCLRADAELIARGCDLTFVEYAVNDNSVETRRRNDTREGLIRKLLAAGQDVVVVYTFGQGMYDEMMGGKVPASIAEFELIAEHYGLGSVWAGLYGLNDVRAGWMRWEEWLPDSLHPTHRGSWSYGQAVIAFLQKELGEEPAINPSTVSAWTLPAPLSPSHWQETHLLPLSKISTQGPWALKRVHDAGHLRQVLETHSPGARLGFEFTGRGLVLIFDYGKKSSEFTYRLDGGEWLKVERERPYWAGDRGMFGAFIVSDQLEERTHTFEMEVVHGNRPECGGTACRLSLVGVIKGNADSSTTSL